MLNMVRNLTASQVGIINQKEPIKNRFSSFSLFVLYLIRQKYY